MGTINDALVTWGPYDISGEQNTVDLKNAVELAEYRVANPAGTTGQLPIPYRCAVAEDFSLTGSGYQALNGKGTTAILLSTHSRQDILIGVSDERGVGKQVIFSRCVRGDYARTGTVGEALQYNFSAMSNGAIWVGAQGAYSDVTADGNGAGFQFGAVGASQRLTLALAAERLTGTGTLAITWKTATANTFVGETLRATFTTFGATAEEVISVAGAITDTWGRPVYDVTGTGTFRVRIYVSIG